MSGTVTVLLAVEIALTALVLVMWMWRGFLDMKEDDHLLLSEAESHLQREQAAIRARVSSLTRYIKVFAVMWVMLAVGTLGTWIVSELKLI
ncbi:MAG TPA: hypothetical protein VFR05_05220 [Terriglobia bacterium]|nr:hypothetical protein [Terriglobia bacterium]